MELILDRESFSLRFHNLLQPKISSNFILIEGEGLSLVIQYFSIFTNTNFNFVHIFLLLKFIKADNILTEDIIAFFINFLLKHCSISLHWCYYLKYILSNPFRIQSKAKETVSRNFNNYEKLMIVFAKKILLLLSSW